MNSLRSTPANTASAARIRVVTNSLRIRCPEEVSIVSVGSRASSSAMASPVEANTGTLAAYSFLEPMRCTAERPSANAAE